MFRYLLILHLMIGFGFVSSSPSYSQLSAVNRVTIAVIWPASVGVMLQNKLIIQQREKEFVQ